MKKEKRFGCNHVICDEQAKFASPTAAINAMTMLQMHFALAGYYTTSSINLRHGKVELTLHFSGQAFPTHPQGYLYTRKDVNSHWYWSDVTNNMDLVRCVDYQFKF